MSIVAILLLLILIAMLGGGDLIIICAIYAIIGAIILGVLALAIGLIVGFFVWIL